MAPPQRCPMHILLHPKRLIYKPPFFSPTLSCLEMAITASIPNIKQLYSLINSIVQTLFSLQMHIAHMYATHNFKILKCYMCNSVETAQPGDRTTNPGIVMPERYASSQRVDSLARVVITPVRYTHTRLHMFI